MAESSNTTAPEQSLGRFHKYRLRRASYISANTGERVKRAFTLREASKRPSNDSSETEPLLGRKSQKDTTESANPIPYIQEQLHALYSFANSKTGRAIIKCSFAYFLGSLVTFIPALSALIGREQDSKHLVCSVTIWFNPAWDIGDMLEATGLGLFGFFYASFLGFTSMGLSIFFRSRDLLSLGHAIVLIVFVGGGMGLIAYTKQRFGNPLVNTACTIAVLGSVNILVKEGSVQAGYFSTSRVSQVLEMVMMGLVIATAVNILVLPVSARRSLRSDFEQNTNLLGELLISITRAFLSGREEDLHDEYFTNLQKEHQKNVQKMAKDLGAARNENLIMGKEQGFLVSARIVDCLEGLAQDVGGLRSAALAQFALIKTEPQDSSQPSPDMAAAAESAIQEDAMAAAKVPKFLDMITEAPEESPLQSILALSPPQTPGDTVSTAPLSRQISFSAGAILRSPSDIFFTFMKALGPPTKSLAYTLKQILDELPYKKRSQNVHLHGLKRWLLPDVEVAINENFRSSLLTALDMYKTARKDALESLYASRALAAAYTSEDHQRAPFSKQRQTAIRVEDFGYPGPESTMYDRSASEILADIEEVTATCGHFSTSLIDFAGDVVSYLDLLEELRDVMEHPTLSWRWMAFWRRSEIKKPAKFRSGLHHDYGDAHGTQHDIPEPLRKVQQFPDHEERPWYHKIYKILAPLRRDDVRFAIKVGFGALLFVLPAFIDATRPFFVKWKGEWGLISYMAVATLSVGGTNENGVNRVIGTVVGAIVGLCAWVLANDKGEANPYLLGFFGWVTATTCFYLILAKQRGPFARFTLLTYNLSVLYAYSLSMHDDDNDDDEGGISPEIYLIVGHRLAAVLAGVLWGGFIVRFIWPISARRKLHTGLCLLWLRMALVWKRDPLAMLLGDAPRSSYMDIREETELQSFLNYLNTLRGAATREFELRGPFPEKSFANVLERTRRMLDSFHTLNVVITKGEECTAGEAAVLIYTREQRLGLSSRISHLFSVLASTLKLEYPLNDTLPTIDNTRGELLARVSEFRKSKQADDGSEQDYERLYAFVLVTGQLARDVEAVSAELGKLFGSLNEEDLRLT